MSTLDRVSIAAQRLDVPYAVALPVANRDVSACQTLVDALLGVWEATEVGSCCKPRILHADHYPPACEHKVRIWFARDYLELARSKAPIGTFPCKCNGSGVFRSGGGTHNGEFTGRTGTCYGCSGKGWQTADDRTRCTIYFRHYYRVYA